MPLKNWSKHILAAGCILAGMFFSGCRPKVEPAPARPAEVAVVGVQPDRVVLSTELPGRINAFLVAEIRPQVSGLLQKRLFEEGTYVKEDQILYQIDPAGFLRWPRSTSPDIRDR